MCERGWISRPLLFAGGVIGFVSVSVLYLCLCLCVCDCLPVPVSVSVPVLVSVPVTVTVTVPVFVPVSVSVWRVCIYVCARVYPHACPVSAPGVCVCSICIVAKNALCIQYESLGARTLALE